MANLEARVATLEEQFAEWERVLSSGDPVGNAQRVLSQRRARLADVPNPAKLTEAQIQEISGDDGTDTAENSANRDVAEGLREAKADATPAKGKQTAKGK